MGYIIAGAIVIGIIAGICYGIYELCVLIWNTTVCSIGWLDATFSITLIIVVLAVIAGIIVLAVGLIGDYDGCKASIVKVFLPAVIMLGAVAGLIATYGMVEPSLYGIEKIVSDPEIFDYFMSDERGELLFMPGGTIEQIFASVIFIGIALSVITLAITILWNLFSVDTEYWEYECKWQPMVALFFPSLLLGGALFGWAYMIVFFVWDYPLFDAIIHGMAITACALSIVASLSSLLWKWADWGDADDYGGVAAGFSLGLGAAISFVAYTVFGAKILVDLMSEYYLWIILGVVGVYIILGVLYCLLRINKIKEFISDGIYQYWHK